MNKEMLDIVNDLSKKPTTDLALQIMELSGENLILEQQCKKQKEVIDKIKHILNNQINYREFVDIVNAIEDVIKEVE